VSLLRAIFVCSCGDDVARYPALVDALVTCGGPVVLFLAADGADEDVGCKVLGLAELAPEGARKVKVVSAEDLSRGTQLDVTDLIGVACPRSVYVDAVRHDHRNAICFFLLIF
jgi:hypothetical protein